MVRAPVSPAHEQLLVVKGRSRLVVLEAHISVALLRELLSRCGGEGEGEGRGWGGGGEEEEVSSVRPEEAHRSRSSPLPASCFPQRNRPHRRPQPTSNRGWRGCRRRRHLVGSGREGRPSSRRVGQTMLHGKPACSAMPNLSGVRAVGGSHGTPQRRRGTRQGRQAEGGRGGRRRGPELVRG